MGNRCCGDWDEVLQQEEGSTTACTCRKGSSRRLGSQRTRGLLQEQLKHQLGDDGMKQQEREGCFVDLPSFSVAPWSRGAIVSARLVLVSLLCVFKSDARRTTRLLIVTRHIRLHPVTVSIRREHPSIRSWHHPHDDTKTSTSHENHNEDNQTRQLICST